MVEGRFNFDDIPITDTGYEWIDTAAKGKITDVQFSFQGLWSNSSGNLCMVGSASGILAVLKLSGFKTPCNPTGVVSGRLESFNGSSSSFYTPIPLLMFPKWNCEYSQVSHLLDSSLPENFQIPNDESLALSMSSNVCNLLWVHQIDLEYENNCGTPEKCSPFGSSLSYLPQVMSVRIRSCSEEKRYFRFTMEFPRNKTIKYHEFFSKHWSLIAVGEWNSKKRIVSAIGCRLMESQSEFSSLKSDDCSIRMVMRFPKIYSILNRNFMAGYLWSTKPSSDPSFFPGIKISSLDSEQIQLSGSKYSYTMIEKTNQLCPGKIESNVNQNYPQPSMSPMKFLTFNSTSIQTVATPLFVGEQGFALDYFTQMLLGEGSVVNISYTVDYVSDEKMMSLNAEGIYDVNTGKLCMVGCRLVDTPESYDCDIIVDVQFPPVNSNLKLEGEIRSTRKEDDPLWFREVSFSFVQYYNVPGDFL